MDAEPGTHAPRRLVARIAVVGSGPGGTITAACLAEAGLDVLLIEEGPNLPLHSCLPFSRMEMEQKYRNGGLTLTWGKPRINYVEARCVGGGSEINSALYHRTPPDILASWRRDFQVRALTESDLEPHFLACERDLSVSYLPGLAPAASLKLRDGAAHVGWKCIEVPRWFRYQGRPGEKITGVRQTMTQSYLPRFLAAGGRLLPGTAIQRIASCRTGWRLHGRRSGSALTVDAGTVFACCGTIQTAALLRRSGLRGLVGQKFYMHPTAKVVAHFAEEVNAPGMGVPVHQVKEFAPRFSFGCSISTPPHLALSLMPHTQGVELVRREPRNLAIYYVMTSGGRGAVRCLPGFRDPLVRYGLSAAEMANLSTGLRKLCECLLAGGARTVYPSMDGIGSLSSREELDRLPTALTPAQANLMTIHLFGSCPMGENRSVCVTDSFGRVHGTKNLYIADGSLLCGPPGVNPQGSIMAVARRNAFHFLQHHSGH
jgi:choline dehydrogenase-like flavoprotein